MKGTELMDRIRDEMAAANDSLVSMIGELLTEYLLIHPEAEIDEKHTLRGAAEEMEKNARKKQKNGRYAYGMREGFDFIMDYFGFTHANADHRACLTAMIGQTETMPSASMIDVAVSEIREAAARYQENSKQEKTDVVDLFDLDALLEV